MEDRNKKDRIGLVLYVFYLAMLVMAVCVAGKIVYFQLIWHPEPKIAGPLTPSVVKRTIEPVRGNILDCNGRLLAMSYPVYDIRMDCTVRKNEFALIKDPEKSRMKESEWLRKSELMAEGLSHLVPGTDAAKLRGINCLETDT